MKDNQEFIRKTIETSDLLNGGQLNPEQQRRFVVLLKRFATMLPLVRSVDMKSPKMEVDKLYVGEPITESADENTQAQVTGKPKFGKVDLEAQKVRSAWNTSTETLQANIEQDNIETTVFTAMTGRIATDLELLSIQGDTSISPGATDPVSKLLRRLNGWAKQTDSAHVFDAGGNEIQKGIFAEMKRMLPKQYRNDPNLRWFLSDTIADDWLDVLSGRETVLGDQALQGVGVAPLGIPIVKVPLIPDDLQVVVAAGATPAVLVGERFGPFVIVTGSNDTLDINIDADIGGPYSIVLPAGTLDAVTVANLLNQGFVANGLPAVAEDDGDGQIKISTTTEGASSAIEIAATGDAQDTLGLAEGTVNGADSGGSVPEGSFLWLANPKNFIWGILDGTRVFSEFNKDFDRIESVVYNQIDAKIENIDAIVKAKNVRRRQLVVEAP